MNAPSSTYPVRISLPIGVVPRVRESVLLLCGATAEGLHLTIGRHADGPVDLDEVHDSRARLDELDSLLRELDVPFESTTNAVSVHGTVALLHDVVYGALVDAGERIAVACEASWRGAPIETVLDLASEILNLEAVLRQVDEQP